MASIWQSRAILLLWRVLAATACLVLWVLLPLAAGHPDFHINFLGSVALRVGLDPYDPASLRQIAAALGETVDEGSYTAQFGRFIQPPISAVLITPLVPLGEANAFLLYYGASVVAFLIAIILGAHLSRGACTPWRWIRACAFAWPVTASLALGQVDGFIAFALGLSCWAIARKPRAMNFLAGFPIGLATGLKVLPGIFLVYFVLTRRWRALAWGISGGMLTALLPAFLFGWDTTLLAFLHRLPSLGGGSALAENVSLPGLLARLHVGPTGYYVYDALPVPMPVMVLSGVVSLSLAAWTLWRTRAEPPVVAYLTLVLASLLAAPIAWDHYPTWLLPFLATPLAALNDGDRLGRWLLGTGIVLLIIPFNTLYWVGALPASISGLPWRQVGLALLLIEAMRRHGSTGTGSGCARSALMFPAA